MAEEIVTPPDEPAEKWSASHFLLAFPFLILGGLLVTYALVAEDPFLGWCASIPSLLLGLLFLVIGCAAVWQNRYPVLRRLRILGRLPVDEDEALRLLSQIETEDVDPAEWRRVSFAEGRRGYLACYESRTGGDRTLRVTVDGWTGAVSVLS